MLRSLRGTCVQQQGGTPDVRYTYQIDGKPFTGNRIAFGQKEIMSNSDAAQRVVREYPEAKSVDVYFDPNDPETSVLEPGIIPGSYQEPGFGLFFMLGASGFLFLDRRMRLRRSRTTPSPDAN